MVSIQHLKKKVSTDRSLKGVFMLLITVGVNAV